MYEIYLHIITYALLRFKGNPVKKVYYRTQFKSTIECIVNLFEVLEKSNNQH